MRRSLRRLRQRRDNQRVTRVDRHHRRADTEPRYGRADHSGEGDRVVIVLLAQPDLADAEVVRTVACATTSSRRLIACGLGNNTIPVGIIIRTHRPIRIIPNDST